MGKVDGCGTNIRLDDPLPPAHSCLRASHRRVTRHKLCRYGRQFHAQKRSYMIFQTDFYMVVGK